MKPSKLIKDVTFNWEADEKAPLGPHLAYTLSIQGGAASGYNKPLVFKSEDTVITPEVIEVLKSLNIDTTDIEKALFSSDKQSLLNEALRDKEFVDKYDYCYVSDYNDNTIIFCCDKGLYMVGYSLSDLNVVTIQDAAVPVVTQSSYVEVEGKILISDDMEDKLESGMYTLVAKSLENVKVQEDLMKATKTEGSDKLTAKDYAYTPDKEKVSTWKLRIDDANHVRAAVAALGKGFRGQKVEIPSADRDAVIKRVRTAYKKFYPANELPEIIKSVDGIEDSVNTGVNKSGVVDPVNTNKNKTQGDLPVDMNEVMKSAEFQELIKAQIAEVTKAKDAELDELKKAQKSLVDEKNARISNGYTNMFKSFEFVDEAEVEGLVKGLMVADVSPVVADLVKSLEKAQELITKVKAEFSVEQGVDGKPKDLEDKQTIEKAALDADIAAKYAGKDFL